MGEQVIIYHDNCPDGWGAAWWLGKHIGEHTKFAGRYGEAPPLELCRGAAVWLVDFAYPGVDLLAVRDAAKTVTLFDHHASTVGYLADAGLTVRSNMHTYCDLSELGGLNKFDGVLDQEHSGVGLVAAYVLRAHGCHPSDFLVNIEDRDLWRFVHASTKDVFAAVTARPYTVEAWDQLDAMPHAALVAEGAAINLYRDRLVEQVAASTLTLRLGEHLIPCASAPYAIGSDVAGLLAAQAGSGIGAYCILHADNVQLGLRSTPTGPDVAALAEMFGGGGHPHASGLRMTRAEFFGAVVA